MWQTLMDLLPDLRIGTFEVRDLLNLLMTGFGAFLAWMAIRINRKQAEIADIGHKLMEQERAKKGNLFVFALGPHDRESHYVYPLWVVNNGTKAIASFHWEVCVSNRLFVRLHKGYEGDALTRGTAYGHIDDVDNFVQHTGVHTQPLYPGAHIVLATVLIDRTTIPTDTDLKVKVFWRFTYEDGTIEGKPDANMAGMRVLGSAKQAEIHGAS